MARYPRNLVRVGLGLVLCLAAMLGGGAAHAAMNPGGATIKQTMMAGPYKLVLDIGPLQQMYTMAQYKKMHPKSGEVMVAGAMVMGGMGMKGPMPNHHLELHVYDAASGKTITKAMVMITIEDTMGKVMEKLPIAEMYGIQEGMADFHFGNNVYLKTGSYMVATRVNATAATFKVAIGKSSGGMSM